MLAEDRSVPEGRCGKLATIAKGLGSFQEKIIAWIFPHCFTPARSLRAQPSDAFIRQSDSLIAYDALGQLGKISAPTQITFGRHNTVTSTRFSELLKGGIKNSELHVFEDCAQAAIYENVAAFNEKTLAFLKLHAG